MCVRATGWGLGTSAGGKGRVFGGWGGLEGALLSSKLCFLKCCTLLSERLQTHARGVGRHGDKPFGQESWLRTSILRGSIFFLYVFVGFRRAVSYNPALSWRTRCAFLLPYTVVTRAVAL